MNKITKIKNNLICNTTIHAKRNSSCTIKYFPATVFWDFDSIHPKKRLLPNCVNKIKDLLKSFGLFSIDIYCVGNKNTSNLMDALPSQVKKITVGDTDKNSSDEIMVAMMYNYTRKIRKQVGVSDINKRAPVIVIITDDKDFTKHVLNIKKKGFLTLLICRKPSLKLSRAVNYRIRFPYFYNKKCK